MATIEKRDGDLVVTLDTFEKVEGLHGDLKVPLDLVHDVEILEDPIREIHGLRPTQIKLAGTYVPGMTAVGTFLAGFDQKPVFAAIHHNSQRGVRIGLVGHSFSALVIGTDHPEDVVRMLALPGPLDSTS